MVHHRKYPLFSFDIDFGAKVTQNVNILPLHNVTYALAKFDSAFSNRLESRMGLHEITSFDLWVKGT